jgi:hypothetical protein
MGNGRWEMGELVVDVRLEKSPPRRGDRVADSIGVGKPLSPKA